MADDDEPALGEVLVIGEPAAVRREQQRQQLTAATRAVGLFTPPGNLALHGLKVGVAVEWVTAVSRKREVGLFLTILILSFLKMNT